MGHDLGQGRFTAMRTRPRLLRVIALVLASGGVAAGQAPAPPLTPTFRADVEYVEVDALVTDEQGNFVHHLTADDFEVLEDGRPQRIVTFSLVDIPVERFDGPLPLREPIEPDVATNEEPFSGRVYVMVLDDLHTDVMRSERVRIAARQFIQRNLGANDLMAVVHTGAPADFAQEFTNSRRRLLESVNAFVGRKLPSATVTRNEEFARQGGLRGLPMPVTGIIDPMEVERSYAARNTLESLQRVAEWFGSVRGRRKTILFVSEGIDYDISDVIRGAFARESPALQVSDDIREAVSTTARSNVSIYSIDPRGLSTLADDVIGVATFADVLTPPGVDPDGVLPEQPRNPGAGIGLPSLRQEMMLSQDNLRTLAEETNGFAVLQQNDFADAFDRIVRDNSTYYVLAYYPPSTQRDGRFHSIEVRVKKPGLTVRARRGYASPRGDRPDVRRPRGVSTEVIESLNSPLPVNGLRMRAFAAPFRGEGPNASVVVGIELVGQDLSLTENGRIEISYVVVDSSGRTHSEKHDALTPNLRAENRVRVQDTGLRFVNRFNLPPGRYQVRIAAHDHGRDVSGSAIYDLDVPAFDDLRFSISGVVLTSMSGAAFVTARADEGLQGVLPAPPIAFREFPQNDEVGLFAEVYDNTTSTPHGVDILTTVRGDDGAIVFSSADRRNSSELGGVRGAYGHTARITLGSLSPGLYVLSVEARSRAGNEESAIREIRFRVVPAAPAVPQ